MFRKIVWMVVAAIAVTVIGCDAIPPITDHQKGEAAGRAVIRKARQEAGSDPVSKAAQETMFHVFPMQTGPCAGKSADFEAGYRKGYTDEVAQP